MARKAGFLFSTEKQIAKIKERQAKLRAKEKGYKRTQTLIKNISRRGHPPSRIYQQNRQDYANLLQTIVKPTPVYNKEGNVIAIRYTPAQIRKIEKISKLSKRTCKIVRGKKVCTQKSAKFILTRYLKNTEGYKELKKIKGRKPTFRELIDPERVIARDEWYKEHEMELKGISADYKEGKISKKQREKQVQKLTDDLCDTYGVCPRGWESAKAN